MDLYGWDIPKNLVKKIALYPLSRKYVLITACLFSVLTLVPNTDN